MKYAIQYQNYSFTLTTFPLQEERDMKMWYEWLRERPRRGVGILAGGDMPCSARYISGHYIYLIDNE